MRDFHLHLARFSNPRSVSEGLLATGTDFNTIACEPWEWKSSLKLIEQGLGEYNAGNTVKKIEFAFGIHPMIAVKTRKKDLERLEDILRLSTMFQVGECGLDKRFGGYEPGGIQEQVFLRQVELAKKLSRPLQIHCVGDYQRILKILEPLRNTAQTTVTFHRFGGDISVVRSALKLLGPRALFSLHADSFRKKSTVLALREIPPEQVRFETDADESFVEKFGDDVEEMIRQLTAVEALYRETKSAI